MKIGITERGDAGIDIDWVGELSKIDGAILITKNITNSFIKVLGWTRVPLIIHATTTGWGGSVIEPNVPHFEQQLSQLEKLIEGGFPKERVVLRIDPVIPIAQGFAAMKNVLNTALDKGLLPNMRVRISILDNYPHVMERFAKNGMQPLYQGKFKAPATAVYKLYQELLPYIDKGIVFETCAEPDLQDKTTNIQAIGCLSNKDLELMNLPLCTEESISHQRGDCLCLGNLKTELFKNKTRCPHQCIYCYWKG